MKKIAVGCDPNAVDLKAVVKKHLSDLGYEWEVDTTGLSPWTSAQYLIDL
jgi:ribose 5-phosphate isomerase RpiB